MFFISVYFKLKTFSCFENKTFLILKMYNMCILDWAKMIRTWSTMSTSTLGPRLHWTEKNVPYLMTYTTFILSSLYRTRLKRHVSAKCQVTQSMFGKNEIDVIYRILIPFDIRNCMHYNFYETSCVIMSYFMAPNPSNQTRCCLNHFLIKRSPFSRYLLVSCYMSFP